VGKQLRQEAGFTAYPFGFLCHAAPRSNGCAPNTGK
jgi:hypothetical protein